MCPAWEEINQAKKGREVERETLQTLAGEHGPSREHQGPSRAEKQQGMEEGQK